LTPQLSSRIAALVMLQSFPSRLQSHPSWSPLRSPFRRRFFLPPYTSSKQHESAETVLDDLTQLAGLNSRLALSRFFPSPPASLQTLVFFFWELLVSDKAKGNRVTPKILLELLQLPNENSLTNLVFELRDLLRSLPHGLFSLVPIPPPRSAGQIFRISTSSEKCLRECIFLSLFHPWQWLLLMLIFFHYLKAVIVYHEEGIISAEPPSPQLAIFFPHRPSFCFLKVGTFFLWFLFRIRALPPHE